MTVRRWIQDGKIPEPYLHDAGRSNMRLYSIGELTVILRVLSTVDDAAYFTRTNPQLVETLHQHIQAYRATHI